MIKLTATQLSILAAAHDRDDSLAVPPERLKPAAATKMAARLLEQGLCREIRAKAEMPIWREDEQGKTFSLKILKAGRAAVAAARGTETHGSTAAPSEVVLEPGSHEVQTASTGKGSKRDLIVAMMQRPDGASIDDLISATGWLPHTTRAALSGLRKNGFAIVRSRDPNDHTSVYKIAGQLAAAVAA